MSLVYITHHDENIFDVEKPKDFTISRKRFKYTSKFKKMIRDEKKSRHVIILPDKKKLLTSSVKNCHQTMGYAITPPALPCEFLKKNHGVRWQRLNEHKCPPKRIIPPVPLFQRPSSHKEKKPEIKKDKEDLMCPRTKYFKGHKYRTNFVNVNVDLMKKAKPKRPLPRYIDTPVGTTHQLIDSGLIPQHICKAKFGRVPCYLERRKNMLKAINARCAEAKLEAEDPCLRYAYRAPTLKKVTDDERNEILKGLRVNYTNLFKIYQSLSVCTDTVAKMLKKGKMENDLRQLEQDMYLLEHNPEIFISTF